MDWLRKMAGIQTVVCESCGHIVSKEKATRVTSTVYSPFVFLEDTVSMVWYCSDHARQYEEVEFFSRSSTFVYKKKMVVDIDGCPIGYMPKYNSKPPKSKANKNETNKRHST